jgi:hypothetical protein
MKGRRSARKFRGHNLGTASRNHHHCSSYDALAETINGLYKTELIRPRKPWRAIEAVELATAEWVDWFKPPPPLRILRGHPTRRTRESLLRSNPETSRRLSSHTRKSPDSPGRFKPQR